jgi:hypothetical protein
MERLRILVGGFLGLLPAGGVSWDYIQYPVGLAALGHDVYYVEDTGLWPVFQAEAGAVNGSEPACARGVAHLAALMESFGLGDRWAYRDAVTGSLYGIDEPRLAELCRTADVLLNLSCSTPLREPYAAIPARVLVDSDPMFTQIQAASEVAFTPGESRMRALIAGHTHHFTFGENVGSADCRMPSCGVTWRPTRQPICLEHWPGTPVPDGPCSSFTTVMNWSAGRLLVHGGETWGQKDVRFLRVVGLPRTVPGIPLTVAVGRTTGTPFPAEEARRHGWRVLDPETCAGDWREYRDFIRASRGEFSVAKETYVKARTGWFSCRSACYLASGRPVVAEDTGWSLRYPTGEGLFAFDDAGTAAEALGQIVAEPQRHARAARAVAEEFFDSNLVLSTLLSRVSA